MAIIERDTLYEYINNENYIVATGRKINLFMRQNDKLDTIKVDMGVRIPLSNINEKFSKTTDYIAVSIPYRDKEGKASFVDAYIFKDEDYSFGYLKLTKKAIINQAFKLFGEVYGWGGMNEARYCYSLILDVYRCFGIVFPRNTDQQEKLNEAYNVASYTGTERNKVFDKIAPGSALYMGGHTMLYLGKYQGKYYILHDVTSVFVKNSDGLTEVVLNEAAITDLSVNLSSGKSYFNVIRKVVTLK